MKPIVVEAVIVCYRVELVSYREANIAPHVGEQLRNLGFQRSQLDYIDVERRVSQ